MEDIPVLALKRKTLDALSAGLNDHKLIPSDDGLPRDWRGLAHLIGLNGVETSRIGSSPDPMSSLMNHWGKNGNLGQLQGFLALIDRFDVLDDTKELIDNDVAAYRSDSSSFEITEVAGPSPSADGLILTRDDVIRLGQGLQPQTYDAYMLFAEEDIEFASNIVQTMETQYRMKLCIRDRDLIGGIAFEHDAVMKLIAERCRRLLVVVSSNFLRSTANKFFVTFAQALGIDQRQRKVIPILYEKCNLPPELSYYFLLDYTRAGVLWNFWDKLRDSIQAPDSAPAHLESVSPWMRKTDFVQKEHLPLPVVPKLKEDIEESEVRSAEKNTTGEQSKKPLLKNITSSISQLVVSSREKIVKDKSKEEAVNKPVKKKWYKKNKLEPVLS